MGFLNADAPCSDLNGLDMRVPVLGPFNGDQATQIQLPDGSILVGLNGLNKVLGALQSRLSGMLKK